MGLDRIVRWLGPAPDPSSSLLHAIAADYVGRAGWVLWGTDCGLELPNSATFDVDLRGDCSEPLLHVPYYADTARVLAAAEGSLYAETRGFEVYCGEGFLTVTTRHQDPFTNAVALGLARVYAHHLEGRLEVTDARRPGRPELNAPECEEPHPGRPELRCRRARDHDHYTGETLFHVGKDPKTGTEVTW